MVSVVVCRVDSDGESGVGYVVRLLVHMLDPTLPEYTAAFTGRLIIVFIKRVSEQVCVHVRERECVCVCRVVPGQGIIFSYCCGLC